jgi:hypothetical protein
MALGGGPGPHGAEFDETAAFAGLARRPPIADREAGEAACTSPQQKDVAETARRECADLGAEIEPLVKRFGHLAAGGLGRAPVSLGQLGIARPAVPILPSPDRGGGGPSRSHHDRGQKAGVKAEFLIKRQMQGAVRKGEEPGVAHAPFVQLRADGLDELFRDALSLPVGRTVIGPKKPTLPQRIAKFEPTSSPSSSAAKLATCSAPKRP